MGTDNQKENGSCKLSRKAQNWIIAGCVVIGFFVIIGLVVAFG